MSEPEHSTNVEGRDDQNFRRSIATLPDNNESQATTAKTGEQEVLSSALAHYDGQSSLQVQNFPGDGYSLDDKGSIDGHTYHDKDDLKDFHKDSDGVHPGASSIFSHDYNSNSNSNSYSYSDNKQGLNAAARGRDGNNHDADNRDDHAASHATLDVVVESDGVEEVGNSTIQEESILIDGNVQHDFIKDAKNSLENIEEPCSNHDGYQEININKNIIKISDKHKINNGKTVSFHDPVEVAAIMDNVTDIFCKQQERGGNDSNISSVDASQEEHCDKNNIQFKTTKFHDKLSEKGDEGNDAENAKQCMSSKQNSDSNSCSDDEEISFNSADIDDQNGHCNEASPYEHSVDGRERMQKNDDLPPDNVLHAKQYDSNDGSEEPASNKGKRKRSSENHDLDKDDTMEMEENADGEENQHDQDGYERGTVEEDEREKVKDSECDRFPLKQCEFCLEWYHWRGMSMHTLGCSKKIQSKSTKVESKAVAPPSPSTSTPPPPLLHPPQPPPAAPATLPPSPIQKQLRKPPQPEQPQSTPTNPRHFRKQCPNCHRWLFYQGFSSHWRSCGKGLVLGNVVTDLNEEELRDLEERKKRGYKKLKKKPASAPGHDGHGNEEIAVNHSQPPRRSNRQMHSSYRTHSTMGECDSNEESEEGNEDGNDNGDDENSDKSNELENVDKYMRDINLEKDGCVQGLPFERFRKSAGYLNYIVLLNRNKDFVQPHDPRPCIGCFWCGPKVRLGDEGIIPVTMCTICKRLRELGWVRKSFNGSTRFRDEKGVEYHSVKHFLSLSSRMIFSSVKGLRYVGLDNAASPPRQISVQIDSQKDGDGRIESHHETEFRELAHSENHDEQSDQSLDPDYDDVMSTNFSPGFKSRNVSKSVETMMNKRKKYVCGIDPRPCLDCDWCGPSLDAWASAKCWGDPPHEKVRLICPSCKYLKDNDGWMIKHNKNTRYFWNDSRQIKVKSVKDFLVKTTQVLGMHMEDPDFSKYILEATATWNKRVTEQAAMNAAAITAKSKSAARPKTKSRHLTSDAKFSMSPCDEPKLASTLMNFAKHAHVLEKRSNDRTIVSKTSMVGQATEKKASPSLIDVSKNCQKDLSRSFVGSDEGSTCKKSNESQTMNDTVSNPKIIELPNISQLLREKEGLSGVLRKDIFQVFNLNFGTNANIAAKILLSLCKGDIPSMVNKETPFIRTCPERTQQPSGPTPCQFVGVYRNLDTPENDNRRAFSVAIPQFYVDYETGHRSADNTTNKPCPFYKRNGYVIPCETTVKGNLLLLRDHVEDETTAGKFFAFLYRILYGSKAVSDVLADYGRKGNA